ncbi:hypothetical protein BU16DRAFT_531596 [Lophium mytilinum]|uniref:Uncharacterized protein n=1 Tax=Lophium mytilinum TaxID=390894 RepID=A0A6A6QAJ9_9PEZI|nr:hypothetical protein BU16DRAFT_531596 [Lophium mytilinum]
MDQYFFTFGPNDAYISKSPTGLRHRNPPPTLHRLLLSASISTICWAAIGPEEESWVISYVDIGGSFKIDFGDGCPKALKAYLFDPNTLGPRRDKSLRVSFGPKSSFFAWDQTSIRWSGIPSSLEDTIQSWLSPSGWKVGPPRAVALGAEGAWFALSEYGVVAWDIPEEYEALAETWEEWEEEDLDWSELAFVAFDPIHEDQFIAIREDGTWAGAIDDSNTDALEAFASSYFSRPQKPISEKRPSHTSNPSPSRPPPSRKSTPQGEPQSQPPPPKPSQRRTPSPSSQAHYESWSSQCATVFAAASAYRHPRRSSSRAPRRRSPTPAPVTSPSTTPRPALIQGFPYIPSAATFCASPSCLPSKSLPLGLRACLHDVEALFRGSGSYSYEWLRQERLRWHPDRFGRLCAEEFKEEGKRKAEEMWKICEELMVLEKRKAENGK